MSESRVVVSVCMITYNHEEFISKAIEGVMMQQTSFPIELIIGEDCSTDSTHAICLKYKSKYPDKIKLRIQEFNLGMTQNFISTLQVSTGKYIAQCEGDDYWTDPYKLQKQVDFLEANEAYSVCFHRCRHFDVEKEILTEDACGYLFKDNTIDGVAVTTEMFLFKWITQTLTMVYRRDAFNLEFALKYKYFRDMHLIYHLLQVGKGYLFAFDGGVYNVTGNGIFSKMSIEQECISTVKIYRELLLKNKDELLLFHYLKSLQWAIDQLSVIKYSKVKLYNFAFIHFRYSKEFYSFLKNIFKITFSYKK